MKTLSYLKTSGTILILFLITLSCSSIKKTAVLCPELPRNNLNKQVAQKDKKHNSRTYAYTRRETSRRKHENNRLIVAKSNKKNQPANLDITQFKRAGNLNLIEYKTGLIASLDNTNIPVIHASPDIATNTEAVTEFADKDGNNRIDRATQSTINSHNSKVKPSKRSQDFSIPSQNYSQRGGMEKQLEGLGLAGMIVGLVGLFIFGIPCGIIAIVFGVISLIKIKRHPDRFKGKGFAITSLVLGLVDVILLLILLAIS